MGVVAKVTAKGKDGVCDNDDRRRGRGGKETVCRGVLALWTHEELCFCLVPALTMRNVSDHASTCTWPIVSLNLFGSTSTSISTCHPTRLQWSTTITIATIPTTWTTSSPNDSNHSMATQASNETLRMLHEHFPFGNGAFKCWRKQGI